jgi:hypothetical protein
MEHFTTIEMATQIRTIIALTGADIERLVWQQVDFLRGLNLLHFIINFKFNAVKSFIKHFANLRLHEHYNY